MGFVVCEDLEFGEGDDVAVMGLRGGKVFATLFKLCSVLAGWLVLGWTGWRRAFARSAKK